MPSAAQTSSAPGIGRSTVEVWFHRILTVCAVLAALSIVCQLGLVFWAHNEFTTPESIVAIQSSQLAQHGVLYYGLKTYPYTACVYMPQFYMLEAALSKIGLTTRLAGRLLSFAAMLGVFMLVWKLLLLYTSDRNCARTGVVLCASTSLVLVWGTVGQVDMLAVFWSLCAFYQFSRYALRGERTLVWTGVCIVLAVFTKQTAIACPAAIFLLLWSREKWTAIKFACIVGAAGAALALLAQWAFRGNFFLNIIEANLKQGHAWSKLGPHFQYMLIAAAQLFLVALVGARAARRSGKIGPFLYLALALAVLLLTASKLGSDSNYQVETNILLVICACIALDALNFFPLIFSRSKSWLTLLQLPLAVHVVENFRITENVLVTRAATEQMFGAQIAGLRPYVADGGRLLSTDYNSMARLRDYMEVEPFTYSLLTQSGVIDPEPVRRDLANETFSTILLYEDLEHRTQAPDPEVTTFNDAQTSEIQRHYRVVAHIQGPYQDGIYVYQRRGGVASR